MIVEIVEVPRDSVGPPVHVSIGRYWVQIGIGDHKVVRADMVEREWLALLSQLPAVTAGREPAAVMKGTLRR